jgi:hypothetical protein
LHSFATTRETSKPSLKASNAPRSLSNVPSAFLGLATVLVSRYALRLTHKLGLTARPFLVLAPILIFTQRSIISWRFYCEVPIWQKTTLT